MSSERDRAYMLLSRAYAKDLRSTGNAEQADLANLIDELANALERMVNGIESAWRETGAGPGGSGSRTPEAAGLTVERGRRDPTV
jgi:hypothetical protein